MANWYLSSWNLNKSSDEMEINIINLVTGENKVISGDIDITNFYHSSNYIYGLDIAGGIIMPHVYTKDMVKLDEMKLPCNVRIKIAGRNWINAVVTYRDAYKIKFIIGGNEATFDREYLVQHELEIDMDGRSLNAENKYPDVDVSEYFPTGYVHADIADAEKKRKEEEQIQRRIMAREAEKARNEAEMRQKEQEKEAKKAERAKLAEQKKLDKQRARAEATRRKLAEIELNKQRQANYTAVRVAKIDNNKLQHAFKPLGKITGFEIWGGLNGGVLALRRTDASAVKIDGYKTVLKFGETLMVDLGNIKELEKWFMTHVKSM